MSGTIKICRYNKNATGWCEKMKDYCTEGPCDSEELVEYAPVKRAKITNEIQGSIKAKFGRCTACGATVFSASNYCNVCGAIFKEREGGQ